MCSEGTRYCRGGVWSACEGVHSYVVAQRADTQAIVDPTATQATCSICDLKCFKVVDNLLSDGGTAGGNVVFAAGGGLTLQPGDGGVLGMTIDAGGSSLTGCPAMMACCSTLSGVVKTACDMTAAMGNNARCDVERATYCPNDTVSGPVVGCTLGSGADKDCDGIPDVVDYPGKPLTTSNNQAIFHQLDIGETAQNSLDISFKLRNADVYFLLDMTATMQEERDNLIASLTAGNVINCAHLNQCCNKQTDPMKLASCQAAVASYTNRPGKADDQAKCLAEQPNYCPGSTTVDCPDLDFDGKPDNYLKTQGVVGAVKCLVGSSWFGAGFTRDIPIFSDPQGCTGSGCGIQYGDRDEQVFRHVVDMTPDFARVSTALSSMVTNGNHDEPEGGMMALYSVITGKGHYFGINRPSVPDRLNATGCAPNSFGYPCFRKDAIPIVVFFTDRPHHNGPDDPSHCNGEGPGCPYNHLGVGSTAGSWTSGSTESASDKVARRIPQDAESFSTAYNVGDIRGKYVSLVGDTRFMTGDYPAAIIGCGADANAPDTLIRFTVSNPLASTGGGATATVQPISVNFHLTKDDAYAVSSYGAWSYGSTNYPSPATEFGAVVAVFRGVPNVVTSPTNVGDKTAIAIASGPDATYLTYLGTTSGAMSMPGYLGGISGCGADGATNQVLFTFRPSSDARLVFDAAESGFGTTISLHEGLPSTLPKNPNSTDGSSAAILNTNDTFASANAVPAMGTPIDGAYVERTGDTKVSTIHADYTATTQLWVNGERSQNSNLIAKLSSTAGLYVGMQLSDPTNWAGTPVVITALNGTTATMSANWLDIEDDVPTPIAFDDSLVGCAADPTSQDAVFKFDVSTPRTVRIDTEGSNFDTVISLHDAPPPQVITKSDVGANPLVPGYVIGDVTNGSYTVSDIGTGTSALPNSYDYVQCGAVKTARDAAFKFQLSKTTHLGLQVSSASWNPIVALFASVPGSGTVLSNTANLNDSVGTAPNVPFNLGDVYGQLDTKVTGSNLTTLNDNYSPSALGCLTLTGGKDAVFMFTPSVNTTVRVEAKPLSGWLPVFGVFDGPPPASGVLFTVQGFDTANVTLPDSNCLAYSFHDPATGAAPAHVYTVCPTRQYSDAANVRCTGAGMDALVSVNSAAEQTFLQNTSVSTTSAYRFHLGALDSGAGFAWRDASLWGYTHWASGQPKTGKCADMAQDGTWQVGNCSGSSGPDNAYYICEDSALSVAPPNEDAATASSIDPSSTVVTVQGSTRRMYSDYNGAVLLGACGGTISAGDAVFKITTGSSGGFDLNVDSAGSSYSVVLGLFDGTIDAAGYKTCSASGTPLTYTLLSSRTYYVVVKGTAASPEGNYKIKFANKTAAASGSRLACAAGVAGATTATADVDVDANHTYYVVVDQSTAPLGAFDFNVHALYQTRAVVDNAADTNENGNSAVTLPDPYRSQISVVDTTTAGMAADYGIASNAMCSASAAAPDAVYKFRPSLTTDVKIGVIPQGSGLTTPVIGVFDGLPGSAAVVHDLTVDGNPNETLTNAQVVSFDGAAQEYRGDTTAMTSDVDPALLACGAYPHSPDAVFKFTLAQATDVEIDASGSTVTDPVINLFRSSPLTRPAQVTLENDAKANADANPAPTPTVTASWLYYGADMNHFSSESQTSVSVAAVNADVAPPTPVLQPQDLGDVFGKRINIGGGDTAPMVADYPGGWSCGSTDAAADAIYRFTSSSDATVHIKATPAAGFDTVLGLYDGTNGPPLRLSDLGSVVEDTACVPTSAPSNLNNATLKAIAPSLASAPNVLLNCGVSVLNTTDPDGTGAAIVSFSNWCGPQPVPFVQSQANGLDAVVLLVQNLRVAAGASLRVLGNRPAIFIATSGVNIDGIVTVSPDPTNFPGVTGAGGDFSCAASSGGNSGIDTDNSGGGGGGGYGTPGGAGGYGTDALRAPGGLGGISRGTTTLIPLLGGCSGGRSHGGSVVGLAAGALQISAANAIILSGAAAIRADGADGSMFSAPMAGGTGGGSGGAVLLQAPTITYAANQISANGGNGAQAAGTGTAALGGSGANLMSNPGNVGQNGGATRGGGAGGGGYGRIAVVTTAVSLNPCTVGTNENASSAWALNLDNTGRQYIERGNTASMTADHGGMCGTPATAQDAVYAFTLSKQTNVQIDARGSSSNAVLGLFSAGSLGQAPQPLHLENDDRTDADLAPNPTPDVVSNWVAYNGDLANLTISSQPQLSIDNSGNANEVIPTELPDPINRRITLLNANTSGMAADYLAASCSTPSADGASDALYRFVPSQSGPVRVSANYSQTAFDPVIALYRGSHSVIDERLLLGGASDTALANVNVDASTVKVYNQARTVLYAAPGSAQPDFNVVTSGPGQRVGVLRTSASQIPNGTVVSVDYTYDRGAPLPITQQASSNTDLVSKGNPNERADSAWQVPITTGQAQLYTGNTTAMTSDVDGSLFSCGPPALTSNDAVFSFSLDKPTEVEVSSAGSGYNTAIALFDHAFSRPSSGVLSSPPAVDKAIYDVRAVPGAPEGNCTAYDWNSHRYWFCSTARPWSQAEGRCQSVNLHLVTIEDSFENAEMLARIQSIGQSHQIGFEESVPYTNSWGVWASGGGGTTGSPVLGRFTRWATNEPNASGNCLRMLASGTWDDDDCSAAKRYICELPSTASSPAVPTGATCGSLVTYGGHKYLACTNPLDFASARASCTSVGMDLVRIDDQGENDEVRVLLAGEGWIGGSDQAFEGQWGWPDGTQFWLVNAFRNWSAGEPNQAADSPGSRMRADDGTWLDVPFTTQAFPYICEDPAPGTLVTPPTSSVPQLADVFSPQRAFHGSTQNVPNSVAGYMACGADAAAPDAVFQFNLTYLTNVGVDISGSFPGAVVGLFKGAIGDQGYSDAGSLCATVAAAAPQLSATLQPGTYYAVLTGSAGAFGAYSIRFNGRTSDAGAFRMENDNLSDAMANPLGTIDGQWKVKTADMSHLSPTIGAVRTVDMGLNVTDVNDVNATVLDPVTGHQTVVINASTGDLTAQFPGGSCNPAAAGNDAIYKFTPTASQSIQVRLNANGWNGQIAMYDGSNGTPLQSTQFPAPPINLSPGNSNETRASALPIVVGNAQPFLGNLTGMSNDADYRAFNQAYNSRTGALPVVCNADPVGHDAFFKFTVPGPATQSVEITSNGTAEGQTIAIWDSKPFVKPAGITGEYDTKLAAHANNVVVDDGWYVYRGNTGNMLLPALGYTTVPGPFNDSIYALGDVKGRQLVTMGASTSGLAADYLASTLACGGSSDAARDAVFTFTHSVGGRVQVSLNNPNPAFVPTLALFRGGVGTAASMSPPDTMLNNLNASRATAFNVTPVAAAHTYSGNTSGMVNSYPGSTFTQGAAYGSKVCTPDGGGRDALVMLTVPGTKGIDPPMNVEISSVAAGFDHTIALWDTSPVTAPTAGAMSNDTRAAAFAAPIGALDDGWVVESATMSTLFPAALTAPSPAPTVANNNNIQDLGNPIGKRIKVSGNTSTAGVVGDYAAATLMCGSSDSANDIIYKLRPTSNTTVRVATNNPTPGFSTALAMFNGAAGDPAKMSDTASAGTTALCGTGFAYTPSNFTLASVNFTTAPSVALTCAGPIVFDSSTATFTSGWCSGQTQPVPVVLSQSSGPDIVVLPFKSLSVGSTTVIKLVSSSATSSLERPVVFAVSGNVQIDGAIDASGAGTALGHGAGSNWNCGSSKGGNGGTDLLGLVDGGGGGGGFRSAGGDGGQDGLGSGGSNGVKRTNTSLTPLLGGCGAGDGHGSGATLGVGGGAVQISAAGTLTISATGSVKADGSPGATPSSGGGSGGGSGGAVLLEGQTVTVTGTTSVKGGAGGDSSGGANGSAGSTSTTAASTGSAGSLFNPGGGGGGGGWGWYVTRTVACTPTNETFATALTVPIGATQTVTGTSATMLNNLAGSSFNSGGCAPDATGPDAFFQFTLTATTPIQIQAQGTAYNHTLALFNSGMTAIACNDGTVATGGTITNGALAAGTYYVGLKTRSSGVGGSFQVAFRDTSAGPPYATQMGCSTTNTLDANLLANTDYYVIVKGAAAGQAGAYTLSVTDIGAVADIGCSNDLSAPDAYFEFDVSDPAGRTVTIAMNEDASHLDGSFQLVRDGAPYNNATGDVPYACETNSHTYTGLPQGKYYVVVRGTAVANGAGDKPVEITFRDDGGANALDCADGSSSSAGTITRTLQPGTYYAGITSRNGASGGTYKLQVRDTSVATGGGGGTWVACGDGSYKITYDIPSSDAGQLYSVVVKGAAAGAEGAYTLSVTDVSSVGDSCAVGDPIQMDPSAPDVFYEFTVADTDADGRDVNVALASSSSLDGAYRLFKADGTPVGTCHDRTAPFTYPDLAAGTYYLALRGKNVASGGAEAPYELSIRDQDSFGALECKDGAANLGTTITRTLQPGDYWVGIRNTPGQPNPLNYQLQFRDTASVQPAGALEVANGCNTNVITASVTQNVPYYVVVKGNAVGEGGPYGLTVTDLNSTGGFNCNDDSAAGDAYFEFNVSDPNGRRVTIDTDNSALDTVVALFPAGAPIDATGKIACNDDGGTTAGASKITQDLAPGVYYAVVRAKNGVSNPALPFEISIRDDDSMGSIACGATDVTGPAVIRKQLNAGTYHLVVKGMPGSDKGAYKLRFRDNGPYENAASEVACNDAQNELVYNVSGGKPYYVVVKGAATNQSGPYKLTVENLVAQVGMGCGADPTSPDAFYRFHLSADTRVQIDTLGSQDTSGVPTNTVIGLYDATASYFGTNYAEDKYHTPVGCDDDSGNPAKGWSKITADLAGNRDYYVVVKSRGAGWGVGAKLPYIVNVRDLGTNQPIACADVNSSLLMTKTLPAGDYRVVMSNSTGSGGGGPFDVRFKNLSVASSGATQVACNDAQDELTYSVAAGRPYYVVVKGDAPTDKGKYSMVVETSTSGASMGCNANPSAPDAFFKFHVAKQGNVILDTDGSTADTVIALYPASTAVFSTNYASDSAGAVVNCNDDGGATAGASRITANLLPGDYYLVVKAKTAGWGSAALPFNVSIRDSDTTSSIACASNTQGGKKILSHLEAGDYNLVTSRGSAPGGAYSVKFRNTATTTAETGQRLACVAGGSVTVTNLIGGHDYFVVVKGNNATDAGAYKLTLEDTVSLSAASGSTSVACAPDGSKIDGVYPPGTYYAIVTGDSAGSMGPYTLKAQDIDALTDQNRIACDDNSGPNGSSVIEAKVNAGTNYVVVKGRSATAQGAYKLHVRDVDAVADHEVACGSAAEQERIQYDVKSGKDYTLLLKGASSNATGSYNLKAYDQLGLQSGSGQRLQCVSDAQPTPLVNSNWHTKKVDFNLSLTPDTYYVAVKGVTANDKGGYQLQIGEPSARTTTTYTPPGWTETKDALAISDVRVLPVIATGGDPSTYVPAAEAQAKVVALTTGAKRADGSAIWQKIQSDGTGTGSGLISGIAEIADYLAMDVSLIAVDGPDPGASKFRINVVPVNSPSCLHPHPLVDSVTGACTPSAAAKTYNCNTQYNCTPGSAPKFTVTFTNPADAPVPPNTNDAYGGYHFKLQIIGNKKYLLDEVPVYIIPTTMMQMGPPSGGSGAFQPAGTYQQDIVGGSCPKISQGDGGVGIVTNDLPNWADLYFNADIPEGSSIDFELCTADTVAGLGSCSWWSNAPSNQRKKITVRSKGVCTDSSQCLGVNGYGDGYCSEYGTCQFITAPKIAYDVPCATDAACPNGPLGADDYLISSHCQKTPGAVGYGFCVYTSRPADLGGTLLAGEQGRAQARVKVTLHSDSAQNVSPTLYQWYLTYFCRTSQ